MTFLSVSLIILAVSHAQDIGDELSPRIWYGKRANIKDYPFYAGLVYNSTQYCGAAILSEEWLLTAGHCYESSYLESDAYVWVGAGHENSARATKYKVDLEILHPEFEFLNLQQHGLVLNDIALVRVERPMTFSDKVKPIQLPLHDYEVNVLHSFAGMGSDETENPPNRLMEVTTRTRDIQEFLKHFKKTNQLRRLKPLISKVMMCTKRDGDMPSLCHGDSGGALVRDNAVVGLASFLGNLNADCDSSDCILLTNVFPFVEWIKSVTGLP